MFSIIDYLVYTDYTVHIDDFNWFPHWMSCLERLPYLHWLYSLSGCSVLSTILSTQTSINSYYPDNISCNLFTKCLFQRIALFALTFFFIGCPVNLLSCPYWLRVTLSIQATFPVICSLNTYFKDWLVCISILL